MKDTVFDHFRKLLLAEVNWSHIGFSRNNSKKLHEIYRSWAERYDDEMPKIDYNYTEPMKAAFVKSKIETDSKILDAACGTGYPTMALHEMGYTDLHGIDYSLEMIREANNKNIYKSLTVADLINPIPFATDTFDVVMCIGFFASGHMGSEPIDEFIRILKPNGYLICSIGVNIFKTDGFAKKLQQLQDDNKIEIDHTSDPFLVVPKADFGTAKSKIWSIKKL